MGEIYNSDPVSCALALKTAAKQKKLVAQHTKNHRRRTHTRAHTRTQVDVCSQKSLVLRPLKHAAKQKLMAQHKEPAVGARIHEHTHAHKGMSAAKNR